MNKLVWILKQLLPLKYDTTYIEDDVKKLTIWRMWFGKSFNIKEYILK